VGEIADILTSQGVGVVSKTRVEDLSQALKECRQNYNKLQGNCKNLKIPTEEVSLQRFMKQNINE